MLSELCTDPPDSRQHFLVVSCGLVLNICYQTLGRAGHTFHRTLCGLSSGRHIADNITLSAELFPRQLRSFGAGIALASRYIFAFIQLKIFLVLVDAIGMSGFYWIQAATAIFAGAFALLMLPETRDKTFAKLEIIFAAKESKKNPV